LAGSPWVYRDALAGASVAALAAGEVAAGALALVKANDGTILAKGFADPTSPIAFRALATRERLDEDFVIAKLRRCAELRRAILPPATTTAAPPTTTGYRLVNGEGDGLPGLHVDVYGDVAVVKLDGAGAEAFYLGSGLVSWLASREEKAGAGEVEKGAGGGGGGGGGGACRGPIRTVWYKYRRGRGGGGGGTGNQDEDDDDEGEDDTTATTTSNNNNTSRGRALFGPSPSTTAPVPFLEHGVRFTADVVNGQKTGFFLDQRDNRLRVRLFSPDKRVLNLFSYSGGFSLHAGVAGASHVTSVDVSAGACSAAESHWSANGLDPSKHSAVCADVFAFLEKARAKGEAWDVVVCDPPSFAPSAAAAQGAAGGAYRRVFAASAQVVKPGGILALASCSSHVSRSDFDAMATDALSRAKRKGVCVGGVFGAGLDHPFPLAAPALEYLNFGAYQLD
jgi:23S rRNA (cytosine1962-C5)-methyltransferase